MKNLEIKSEKISLTDANLLDKLAKFTSKTVVNSSKKDLWVYPENLKELKSNVKEKKIYRRKLQKIRDKFLNLISKETEKTKLFDLIKDFSEFNNTFRVFQLSEISDYSQLKNINTENLADVNEAKEVFKKIKEYYNFILSNSKSEKRVNEKLKKAEVKKAVEKTKLIAEKLEII